MRGRVFAGALVAVGLLSGVALSADPSATDKETSRGLYAQGMQALAAHDFAAAEKACGGAFKLVNAPTGALCWGRALEGLGKLVEARDAYLSAARYPEAATEPKVFTAARADGKAAADAIEPRIPTLVLAVAGVSDATPLRIRLDGEDAAGDTARLPRKVNPGKHVLLVGAVGFRAAAVEVEAVEGKEQTVDVQLAREATVATAPPGPRSPSSGPSALTWTSLAVGAAGLAVGSIFGAIAVGQGSSLGPKCSGGTCPSSEQSTVNALSTNETLSDVGFGVGAVGVALWAILFFTSRGAEPVGEAGSARLDVGPASAALRGNF